MLHRIQGDILLIIDNLIIILLTRIFHHFSIHSTLIQKQFDGLCTDTKQLLNTSMHSGTLTIEGFETSILQLIQS